jgi:hypothetical protein
LPPVALIAGQIDEDHLAARVQTAQHQVDVLDAARLEPAVWTNVIVPILADPTG